MLFNTICKRVLLNERTKKELLVHLKKFPMAGEKRSDCEARVRSYIEVHPTAESELYFTSLEMEIQPLFT